MTGPAPDLPRIRDRHLELLLRGDRNTALLEATRILETGLSLADFVLEVLAPVQAQIGLAWQNGTIPHAREKIATEVADILLTIAAGRQKVSPTGLKLVMCVADREHHNLPARMVAELLRADGHSVTFLGTPGANARIGALFTQIAPHAVVISCSLTMNLPGVVALSGLAHDVGIPVIVGGAAFGDPSTGRAHRVGGDQHALTVAQVSALADTGGGHEFAPGPAGARALEWAQLVQQRKRVATEAAEKLMWYSSPIIPRALRTPQNLAECVTNLLRFLEAGTLIDDHITIDYAHWLNDHQIALKANPEFVPALLTTLRDQLESTAPTAASAADAAACTITARSPQPRAA